MISSYTREVWKTRKSASVILLSHRRKFELFVCLCYGVEWYGGVGEMEWHLTDLMSCESMFSLILSPPLSFCLLTPDVCISLSRPLIFDALHSGRMRNCHIFSLFFILSVFILIILCMCVCVSYLIWLDSLCFVCVWPYVCKKIHKISNLLQKHRLNQHKVFRL